MRLQAIVAACVLVLALGCGDDDESPAPPPADGGGGDTAGGDGGGDAGGGTPGGGSGGDGGGAPGPVASPDGTAVVERLDDAAECDGLLPSSAPSAVSIRVEGDITTCGPGISEGGGHVAVMVSRGRAGAEWQVFAPDGTPRQRFGMTFPPGSERMHPHGVFPHADGWMGLRGTSTNTSQIEMMLETYAPDGSPRRREPITPVEGRTTDAWGVAEDPLGGVLAFHSGRALRGNHPCSAGVERFDETGARRSPPAGTGCTPFRGAVSIRGDALVVTIDAGTAFLEWFRADGTRARPPVEHGDAGGPDGLFTRGEQVHLAPLLDGSVAIREGETWTRRIPHLADRAEDAPEWLASRPGYLFRNTRGNRGYALFPPAGASSAECAHRVELRAPSGRLCGTVTLKEDDAACTTAFVDQGWDGTVVQQGARDRCSWRFWPRLLAGE